MVLLPGTFSRSVCILGVAFAGLLGAQTAPVPSPAPSSDGSSPTSVEPVPGPPTAEPDKRVFGVLPNYRTAEDNGIYAPITSHQKLVIATKDTLDYPLFLLGGAFAGLAQLTDEHPDFGQGLKGFAHRYATAYADQAVGNYMTEGILPILFHEDPRYFRRGKTRGGVWSRTGYAATRIFVTKTDKGATSINFAELVGNGFAAAVGNAYYPEERSVGQNLSRWGQALATDAISQILKEFWPDIKQKFFSHHQKDDQ